MVSSPKLTYPTLGLARILFLALLLALPKECCGVQHPRSFTPLAGCGALQHQRVAPIKGGDASHCREHKPGCGGILDLEMGNSSGAFGANAPGAQTSDGV